jgi:co-chaperonin GroES (HSP10)
MVSMISSAMRMKHEIDPKIQLIEESKEFVQYIEPMGSLVLVAVYVRGSVAGKDQKTAGGIIIPDATRDEDRHQGKIGVILKCGPLAFQEDETHKWGEGKPKINDWVVFRVGDTWPFIMDKRTYRFIEDIDIRAVWTGSPDLLI